jgi:hypothetical protein
MNKPTNTQINEILLHAVLSDYAYMDGCEKNHECNILLKPLKIVKKKESGCAWIVTDEFNNLHIAFRGTDSIKDALNNINMIPTPFFNDLGDVHSGYLEYYNKFRNGLIEHVFALKKRNKLNSISTCGHSKGGSVAELLAIDLAFLMKENVSSYTYGSPPVGDCRFAYKFRSLPNLKAYRILNDKDFIKNIPTPYVHVQSKPILIKESGRNNVQKDWKMHPSTIIRHHSMQNYINGIKKLV